MEPSERDYWDQRARNWRPIPPLSPTPDDVAWFENAVASCAPAQAGRTVRALLLGVTPPLAAMKWPAKTEVVAVDWTEAMFRHVWQAPRHSEFSAPVRGDWFRLPLPTASLDAAVGDGCLSAVASLDACARLNREIHRVLRPGGLYGMRGFCRSDRRVAPAELYDALLSGRIRNLHLFRHLLAMAVHGDSREGVRLRDVAQAWEAARLDVEALRRLHEDAPEALNVMVLWKSQDARLSFPTRAEVEELARPWFEILECDVPSFDYGEHFPRFLLRALPG